MSAWQELESLALIDSTEGDLLSVRISVEAYLLEDLLDALSEAPFPINPEIRHHEVFDRGSKRVNGVVVEFPAWHRRLPELERILAMRNLGAEISVTGMLEEIRA